MENQDHLLNDNHLDDVSKSTFFDLGKWARLAGILMLVSGVLSFIASVKAPKLDRFGEPKGSIVWDVISLGITVAMAALLILFSTNIRKGVQFVNRENFLTGVRNLKSYLLFYFILMILLIVILLVALAMVSGNDPRLMRN
jgi:hypothetical protein